MNKLLIYFALLISFSVFGQENYWTKTTPAKAQSKIKFLKRKPVSYTTYQLDKDSFLNSLQSDSFSNKKRSTRKYIILPSETDGFKEYTLYKSGTLSKELQAKYPNLQSFRAYSKDRKEQASIVISDWGIFIEIFRYKQPPLLIQPTSFSKNTYMVFNKKNLPSNKTFECLFNEEEAKNLKPANFNKAKSSDGILRSYRYAVGTTGEYSQFHVQLAINAGIIPSNPTDAQKKQVVLAAVVTTIDRLNTVYERDLGVHLSLVGNEDQVIFIDPATDPYDNTNIISMLNINTQVLNNHIGVHNYDGGHLFTTYPGGGISGLGVICDDNQKARSVTGSDNPIGDPYDIDYVAHEVGHSFGANHTFANSCDNNRNMPTSVEPGSGSTIMAYAGICAPNVQSGSDAYFHITSIKEITQFIIFDGSCAQQINNGNTAPVIQMTSYANKYIPKSTPFMLSATAHDNENDFLTYAWEEVDIIIDNSIINYTPVSTNATGPMFRSYWPTERGTRYFPSIPYILDGTYGTQWEVLPEVSRFINFNITVRDNHPGIGQTPYNSMSVQVDDTTGPFRVTSQGSDVTWLPGETKTITWNVAGTTGGHVACNSVDILLSTDQGNTFSYVLASNVPNDGMENIIVPSNINVANTILMVKGHDRYFFDLAKGKIDIGVFQTVCTDYSTSPNVTIPDNDPTGIYSTLQVNDNYVLEDVNVPVNISHTYIKDLTVTLTSPAGTTVILYDQNCNNQHNIVATFDDQGQNLVCSNVSGDIKPFGVLGDFYGENSQGTWTLFVKDTEGGDIGTLNSWGLTLCSVQSAGVKENEISSLKIWPNPTNDIINISFDPDQSGAEAHISIYDLSGREIIHKEYKILHATFTKQINVSSLSKGIYLATIKYGNHSHTKKLIIK